jgi:kynurenine 3-monooxygenase
MKQKITLVGGGLVGSMLSILLAKKGYPVEVFEARPDMRKTNSYAGRSINLALSDRGWKAIEMAGIKDEIEKVAIPMYGRMIHDLEGNQTFQPYSIHNDAIYSVSRGGLNQALMQIADDLGVQFHFESKCIAADLDQNKLTFNMGNDTEITHQANIAIGTDGAASELRYAMQRKGRFNYRQDFIEHGYKEIDIPAGTDGSFKLEKNALHIWPRKDFMLIALPNPEGNFTCTLFFDMEGELSFNSINTREKADGFFKQYFPDLIELAPDYLDQYMNNPVGILGIVRCAPWNYKSSSLLLGDAAHAIVPFYGQGMNCGFEDCSELMEMLDEKQENWNEIIPAIAQKRKPNADAIADLALFNFIEMRDKTADPRFILQKKMEGEIQKRHPEKWIPLYSMVSFSHTPYAEAWRIGQAQNEFMQEFLDLPSIENRWNDSDVVAAIDQKLANYTF